MATKVSLCVPAFERPGTLRLLIESFALQDYPEKELVISDDSSSGAVEAMVCQLPDRLRAGMRYARNGGTRGFYGNLREVLNRAEGDVMVVLGDDDVLARQDSLSVYAAAFDRYPDAKVASANLVQLDWAGNETLAYASFRRDTCFAAGGDAIAGLLLSSVHIAGLACRTRSDVLQVYPDRPMLFPQVVVAAALLAKSPGIGIRAFCCGARMHERQLGFAATRAKGGVSSGSHGNIEVTTLLRQLSVMYPGLSGVLGDLEARYVRSFITNLVNERVNTGVIAMLKNVGRLVEVSPAARRSPTLFAATIAVACLPGPALVYLRDAIRTRWAAKLMAMYPPQVEWPLVAELRIRGTAKKV